MGRYARNDALYSALLIFVLVALFIGAALSVVGAGTSLPGFRIAGAVLYVLSVGAMVWSVCRFLSRNIAARQRENAASAAVLRGIAQFGQGLVHPRFGLRQIKAHLGVAVQGAPPFAQLGFQLFCSAEQFFRCDHFKINSLLFYKENPLGHWP